MSLERWQPHRKDVVVRPTPDGTGVLVRPRRVSPWSWTYLGTSIAAGFSLSAAVAYVQAAGGPPVAMAAVATLISVFVAIILGANLSKHPERWRFVAWWFALSLAKLPFIAFYPAAFLPLEFLLLIPAYHTSLRASRVVDLSLSGDSLAHADVAYCEFVNADFTRADLQGATFAEVRFRACGFNGAMGGGCRFENCTFLGCDFSDARFEDSRWKAALAQGTTFVRTDLRAAHFIGADLRGADFENADLRGTQFVELSMLGRAATRLEGARLAGARYDAHTSWSADAMPVRSGAIKVD